METTKFNPDNKDVMTYGDTLGPAMEIIDPSDAKQYKEAYIKWQMQYSGTREKAVQVVNANLGYYAGYYSSEVRERVERLFNCSHPIFGSIEQNGSPTAEEAFQAGVNKANL